MLKLCCSFSLSLLPECFLYVKTEDNVLAQEMRCWLVKCWLCENEIKKKMLKVFVEGKKEV